MALIYLELWIDPGCQAIEKESLAANFYGKPCRFFWSD